MSWEEYHLTDPVFCTPMPVMRGLTSALCERFRAVDAYVQSAWVSSGGPAVVDFKLADILLLSPGASWITHHSAGDFLFSPIKLISGGSPYQWNTAQEHFDECLSTLIDRSSAVFTDSTGSNFASLDAVASAAGYSALILPDGGRFGLCLDASWAIQRRDMLNALRYVRNDFAYSVDFVTMQHAGYGASRQAAYSAMVSSGATPETSSFYTIGCECHFEYQSEGNTGYWPESSWHAMYGFEITKIKPDFQEFLPASSGRMLFDAAAPNTPDYDDRVNSAVFNPMGTDITSGANVLPLSNGSFCSYGCGSAVISGNDDTGTVYNIGWQAQNVRVIYDYNTTFEQRQTE